MLNGIGTNFIRRQYNMIENNLIQIRQGFPNESPQKGNLPQVKSKSPAESHLVAK
jgi:hypothetical protein